MMNKQQLMSNGTRKRVRTARGAAKVGTRVLKATYRLGWQSALVNERLVRPTRVWIRREGAPEWRAPGWMAVAAPASAALAGAGAMYFLDPAHGRRRRGFALKLVGGRRGGEPAPTQLDGAAADRAGAGEFGQQGPPATDGAQGGEGESAPSTTWGS
jgi:hypothetical protein